MESQPKTKNDPDQFSKTQHVDMLNTSQGKSEFQNAEYRKMKI